MKNQFKKLGEYLGDLLPALFLLYAILGGIPVLYVTHMFITYQSKMYLIAMLVAPIVYGVLAVLLLKWLSPYYNEHIREEQK